MDSEFVFAGDDDAPLSELIEDDIEPEEAVEDDISEDEQLSQSDRAALLNEIAPTITHIKALIDSFETRLVTAFKLTGRDFIEWQQSPHGVALESLFALHQLIHQYEHAVFYGTSIEIGITRRRLEQRSSEAFDRAKELVEKSMLGKVAA